MKLEAEHSEAYIRSLPVAGGFSVPESYFEELEQNLLKGYEEEVEEKLFIEDTGFEVPQGYFDQLNERIIGNVKGREEERESEGVGAKIIPLFRRPILMWATGLAASAILVSGLYFFQPTNKQTDAMAVKESLGINDVADHLDASELDEDLLCDAGWCNEIEALNTPKDFGTEEKYLDLEEELIIDEL